MKLLYGVCTGEQGLGIGDIITGHRWRTTVIDECEVTQIQCFDGEWVDVFTVFKCTRFEMVK